MARVACPAMPEPVTNNPQLPARAGGAGDPLVLVRYFDVILVLAAAPFVVLAGLPLIGYLAGALVWIASRGLGAAVERRTQASQDVKKVVGVNLAFLFLRAWLVGLTILAVGLTAEREDGLTAAVLLLVAFTVYFAISLILRPHERKASRP
jgi:hypothetical protein